LRQRKDNMGEKRYSMFIMNNNFEISETSVEKFLKSTPNAVRFFLDRHAACVGCGFARFCTLKDVIDTYQLDEKVFIEELTRIANQKH
jgi:succinylglutamate desuccinylase